MDMDKYYPYNSLGSDRVHDADDLARILRALITDGVAMASATHMQVVAAGNFNVTVKAGTMVVQGRIGVNESDKTFTIAAPYAGADRIDRIVSRADYANRKSILLYLQGTPASTPLPPALKDDADGYDAKLAQIYVSKTAAMITQAAITDERAQSGIVIPGNLDTMLLQMQAKFNEWFTLAKDTLGEDAAGNLMNLIQQRIPLMFSASLPASGWNANAPYQQTVGVAGLLATDAPLVDVSLSTVAATAITQLEAYGCVGRVVTGSDQVTVTCYETKPAVDLTLSLKVVR